MEEVGKERDWATKSRTDSKWGFGWGGGGGMEEAEKESRGIQIPSFGIWINKWFGLLLV